SDSIGLTFHYRGTDADGDRAATGSFLVNIADDQPVQGTAGVSDGVNEDDVSTYPATDTSADDGITSASLGISWGADDDTRATGDTFGRHVEFASTGGTQASAGTVTAAQVGLSWTGANSATNLTSGNSALEYVLTNTDTGGQILTAYKGATHDASTKVFEVTLDATTPNGSSSVHPSPPLD